MDDRTEICNGAQTAGMHAIPFETPQQVKRALASFAIPIEQGHQEAP